MTCWQLCRYQVLWSRDVVNRTRIFFKKWMVWMDRNDMLSIHAQPLALIQLCPSSYTKAWMRGHFFKISFCVMTAYITKLLRYQVAYAVAHTSWYLRNSKLS